MDSVLIVSVPMQLILWQQWQLHILVEVFDMNAFIATINDFLTVVY